MRIALGIEYDGTRFAGWQWQRGRQTVQASLEEALARVADEPIRVHASGRTDAGVHALQQVVHFETRSIRPARAWVMGTNAHLPGDIRVLWEREVPEEFHARYSAIARHYRYLIVNRPVRPALLRHQATWCYYALDEARMQIASNYLLGEHDFSSFRAQGCQSKSPFRQMHVIQVRREGDRVTVDLVANAFLHHMVRNIVGVLIAVGSGKAAPDWCGQVLAARSRTCAGVTAPADGLYFAGVLYPEPYKLPISGLLAELPEGLRRFTPTTPNHEVSRTPNSR